MASAVSSIAILGVLGLAFDLGRLYVTKAELQAFSDAAAVAAAYEIDGTTEGISRADAVARSGPAGTNSLRNAWNFDTNLITNVTPTYSTTYGGPYQPAASAPAGSRYIQVQASGTPTLYFLPIVPGISNSSNQSASAIAGQRLQTSIGNGMAPFSPDAHNPAASDFGFTVGQQYTLKWPPPGQRGKAGNTCGGDVGFTPNNSSADRGYIDVGQGNGNSALHDAIVNNTVYGSPYTVGSTINWVPGNKNVGPGVDERFSQDTDTTSTTYSAYTGNGRRIVVVPVNDDGNPATVIGFAAFFMPVGMCGPQNTSPCCAEYIGPAVEDSAHKGAGGGGAGAGSSAGLYRVTLLH